MSLNDDQLSKLAEKELLQEAKRAAVRYSETGPSGWNPCPLKKTNKRFLVNTLQQTLHHNRRLKDETKEKPKKAKDRKLFKGRNANGYCNDNIIFKKRETDRNKDKEGGRGKIKQITIDLSEDDEERSPVRSKKGRNSSHDKDPHDKT